MAAGRVTARANRQVYASAREGRRFQAADRSLIRAPGLSPQADVLLPEPLGKFYVLRCATAQVQAKHVAELQYVGQEFQFVTRMLAQEPLLAYLLAFEKIPQ